MHRKLPPPTKWKAIINQLGLIDWKHADNEGPGAYSRQFSTPFDLWYFLQDRYGKKFAKAVNDTLQKDATLPEFIL